MGTLRETELQSLDLRLQKLVRDEVCFVRCCLASCRSEQLKEIKRKDDPQVHNPRLESWKIPPTCLLASSQRLIWLLPPFPTYLWNSDSVESRNQFALIEGLNLSKRDFLGHWDRRARAVITLQRCCCLGRNTILKREKSIVIVTALLLGWVQRVGH